MKYLHPLDQGRVHMHHNTVQNTALNCGWDKGISAAQQCALSL